MSREQLSERRFLGQLHLELKKLAPEIEEFCRSYLLGTKGFERTEGDLRCGALAADGLRLQLEEMASWLKTFSQRCRRDLNAPPPAPDARAQLPGQLRLLADLIDRGDSKKSTGSAE
jgi:hypothetical protein